MNEEKGLRLRTTVVYGALLLFSTAIAVKLFTIQLVEGDKWRAKAEVVSTTYRTVQPDRGHIYSEDGRLLATSVQAHPPAAGGPPRRGPRPCVRHSPR